MPLNSLQFGSVYKLMQAEIRNTDTGTKMYEGDFVAFRETVVRAAKQYGQTVDLFTREKADASDQEDIYLLVDDQAGDHASQYDHVLQPFHEELRKLTGINPTAFLLSRKQLYPVLELFTGSREIENEILKFEDQFIQESKPACLQVSLLPAENPYKALDQVVGYELKPLN